MDIYRENILDHYRNPRNWGLRDDYEIKEEGINTLCGDKVVVQVSVEKGKVADMRFEGQGCAISCAVASLLSEKIKGQTMEKIKEMGMKNIEEWLGLEVPAMRVKCATLALETVQLALVNHEKS
jgi:nitrogen fixation protein NifU and related proteins